MMSGELRVLERGRWGGPGGPANGVGAAARGLGRSVAR